MLFLNTYVTVFFQLVGHVIKGGGIAITGQEQHVHGGGFDIIGKSGLQGEITLLQLYKAALTAGKAYINHKHHHVNDYTHDDDPNAQQSRKKRASVNQVVATKRVLVEKIPQHDQQTLNSNSFSIANAFVHPSPYGGPKEFNAENQLGTYLKQDFIHLIPTYEEEETYPESSRAQVPSTQAPATTQTEPAEWEVSKILQACSADCLEDAFKKANVMSWQATPKKLFAGALYPKVVGQCYNF